jgi:hypothetical protein
VHRKGDSVNDPVTYYTSRTSRPPRRKLAGLVAVAVGLLTLSSPALMHLLGRANGRDR